MSPADFIAPASALLGAALGALGGYLASHRQAQAAISASREQAQAAQSAAREQIRASTIVASRQRWIDELRTELSAMVGQLLALEIALEKQSGDAHEDWLAGVASASALEGKIALMLNPYEPEHEGLVMTIRAPLNEIRMGKRIAWGPASTSILASGRVVLKNAWDQIKAETALAMPNTHTLPSNQRMDQSGRDYRLTHG